MSLARKESQGKDASQILWHSPWNCYIKITANLFVLFNGLREVPDPNIITWDTVEICKKVLKINVFWEKLIVCCPILLKNVSCRRREDWSAEESARPVPGWWRPFQRLSLRLLGFPFQQHTQLPRCNQPRDQFCSDNYSSPKLKI